MECGIAPSVLAEQDPELLDAMVAYLGERARRMAGDDPDVDWDELHGGG